MHTRSHDLVLGVNWLGYLGSSHTFDYRQLQMQFLHQNQKITLKEVWNDVKHVL